MRAPTVDLCVSLNVALTCCRRGWQTSTREAAFVMAVTAAGITHSVTKSCSKGDLDNCGCDLSLPGHSGQDEGWLWGGCSDLVTHGENVTVKLMESTEPSKMDWRTLVNLHNNAVGRGAVRASLQRRCKCHGLSGSCTTKTCWMQVSNFQDIAKDLRRKYDKAVRVSFEPRRRSLVLGNSAVGSSGNLISEYNTQQLVYMEESPDYCLENNSTGWPGTRGRSCSKPVGDSVTPEEKRSCRNLCHGCGYRVRRNRRYVTKHCNCSFKWCCEVTCDTCTTAVEEHYCE
uniref:Protein Wnt n=1 Tax=Timema cristinae TaxID=61476 RepID=A0A7R9CLT8_TIMCR|nr:unnamed protein product [Timema cristinae]